MEIITLERDLEGVTARRDRLRADLKSNLLKRRDELTARLALGGDEEEGVGGDLESEAQIRRMEREHLNSAVANTERDLGSVEAQLEKKRAEAGKLDRHAEQGRVEEQTAQAAMDEVRISNPNPYPKPSP
jgi:hypothetical protein